VTYVYDINNIYLVHQLMWLARDADAL